MSAPQELNKLREALRTIKNECASHSGNCPSCPLALSDYKCGITSQETCGYYDYRVKPQYWNIPAVKLLQLPKEN